MKPKPFVFTTKTLTRFGSEVKSRDVDEWWVRQNYGTPVLEELLERGKFKPVPTDPFTVLRKK